MLFMSYYMLTINMSRVNPLLSYNSLLLLFSCHNEFLLPAQANDVFVLCVTMCCSFAVFHCSMLEWSNLH